MLAAKRWFDHYFIVTDIGRTFNLTMVNSLVRALSAGRTTASDAPDASSRRPVQQPFPWQKATDRDGLAQRGTYCTAFNMA
jgi:hypothetical protein